MTVAAYLARIALSNSHLASRLGDAHALVLENNTVDTLHALLQSAFDAKDALKVAGVEVKSFRGRCFHEYCARLLRDIATECGIQDARVFEEQPLVIEELYIPTPDGLRRLRRSKRFDLVLGRNFNATLCPLSVASCKTWHDAIGLEDDTSVLSRLKARFPLVVGVSLSMYQNAAPAHRFAAYARGSAHFVLRPETRPSELDRCRLHVLAGLKTAMELGPLAVGARGAELEEEEF